MKFVLTSEHFAQERARLDGLEKELKAARAKLEEFERDAIRLAASFEPVESNRLAKTTMCRKALPRASAPKNNRPYTPEQIEILRTASRSDLAQLATDWGRTLAGLERKREELLATARREAPPELLAAPTSEEPVSEPKRVPYKDLNISSPPPATDERNRGKVLRTEQTDEPDSADIFDNTSGHEWNASRSRSMLKPGKPVRGIMDNGPGDPRILDEVAFSSKNDG